MNITIIHGQTHHGVTYTMTTAVLKQLKAADDEVREFFLPKDGPGFCVGCNTCFLKGEAHCPDADTVQPIALAMEWADVIILDSPNYVMEMSGAMKNLMDHLAYRWVTHRPHGSMFGKVGITVSSSAGAPPNHVVNAMAKQLKWLCVSKVYWFPLISNAMGVHDLKPEKWAELEKRAAKVAKKARRRVNHPHPSLRGRLAFSVFRGMQTGAQSAWNPTDRDWWISQGWTAHTKPWQQR